MILSNDLTNQISPQEHEFILQCHEFAELTAATAVDILPASARLPQALAAIPIEDHTRISPAELQAIKSAFEGPSGVAYLVVESAEAGLATIPHPLLKICEQLEEFLPLQHPITHPMEGHPEARSRFGDPDGTLKIYDLEARDGRSGYREQAETNEMFDSHNDGLGFAGLVRAFALYADTAPLCGGYTFFQNINLVAIELADVDPDAFASLFLPDAITAIRPRGKGAIKVTTPVLFLNKLRSPQNFVRLATGEYVIRWRQDVDALDRARTWISKAALPFAAGSSFVNLSRCGHCCIVDNHRLTHGRTPFINGKTPDTTRVLARKWFAVDAPSTVYRHVPGMSIHDDYARLFADRFGPSMIEGDWTYDASADSVRRVG